MKLKTVEVNGNTYAEMKDGAILFTAEDGKEISYTEAVITRLSAEAMGYRKRTEAAEAKVTAVDARLKAFEGIEDPEAARKALETVSNIDAGKLVQAGKVEEIKAAAKKSAEESVAAAAKAHAEELAKTKADRDKFRGLLHNEKIGGAFARSKFIADKVAVPIDLLQAQFGPRFSVDDEGNVTALGSDGKPVSSHIKFGEPAGFEEAIESLVNEYPYKDQILKGAAHGGSGARPGGGGGNGSKKTISRADFAKLDPAAQRAAAIGKDAMTIVD